ncbi:MULTISPECIES: helix-turn-helix transcriptional regulator [unclassified Nonomuraea]|uniref:helix-turn-helix transcriptional regulator n=1 Tax=unclassified Nonomuraea TaxID=2593643 RepID=UPI0033FA4304
MSLASLGLTDEQEHLYRYLLRHPHLDADAVDLVMPEARRVLAELRAFGLVGDALTALPPAAAVDLLVRRRIEQTRRRLTELTLAWDVLTELAEEHRSGRLVQMVEHIPDGPAVTRRMRALLAENPGEFAHVTTRAHSSTPYDHRPFQRLLARGLRSRTLFPARVLADPAQDPHTRSLHALGDLQRVTVEPTRHLAIVNRAVAFVQADPHGPEAGALEIRQPGLVAMLADVFDGMWDRARDLNDLPLSPAERQVLHALTRHDTDETAARSLNISVRKFRAHIADLMARLGAATRFQAALQAKERGWL